MLKFILILPLFCSALAPANQLEAERIQRGFTLSSEKWMLEMKLAKTEPARAEVLTRRPNGAARAADLWQSISPELPEAWVIPYAAFYLGITQNVRNEGGQMLFAKERAQLLKAIGESHCKNPQITPFSLALIDSGEPQALGILEKIAKENPDNAAQGIAALGAALVLKNLGDAPEVMAKRLNFLRQAIIKSADQKIANSSVADIASDELYVIRFLTKGRQAPSFSTMDIASRTVSLAELKGRTVVLLFWDSQTEQAAQLIRLTNQIFTKYKDQPVTILGVTQEPAERIRKLQGDGLVLWQNISDPTGKLSKEYRINRQPFLYVIDPEGKIQFTGLPGSFVELTIDAMLNPVKK